VTPFATFITLTRTESQHTATPEFVDIPFSVEPNYTGWRLDRYLTAKLRRFSRSRVQRLIESCLVAERTLKAATRITPGLRFVLRRRVLEEPPTPTHVPVLYEDEFMVIVDKPAGLPIHACARYQVGTLVARLRERYGGPGIEPVHRLDRETSGVVICARTKEASRFFMRSFQSGRVHKEYLAICEGAPLADELVVDMPLAVGGALVRIAVRCDPSGRPSRTRFRVVERFAHERQAYTLIRAWPETGRQHQIRAHLRHAGLPIVGDKIYGPGEAYYDRFCKHLLTADDWARLRLARHALHAHRVSFAHPHTGEHVSFSAPLPDDLRQFIRDGRATPRVPAH